MIIENKIETTLSALLKDSRSDHSKMMKVMAKRIFRPIRPDDFKDAYLSISKEQGEKLAALIKKEGVQNIVEFGTSFGISTLYMASGVISTEGKIITTELIESKALIAIENFKRAGVNEVIEVRIGDATETLKNHNEPVDLLFLDGWKDLYMNVFNLLEPNFHSKTIIYVDNADMSDTKEFLKAVQANPLYDMRPIHKGKAVLIELNTKE